MKELQAGGGVGEAFRPPAAFPARKRNRLPLDVYRGPGRFFVTVRTSERQPYLRGADIAAHCSEALQEACRVEGSELLAFCFMPNHCHFLVTTEDDGDLIRLVHRFKQGTGWWFGQQRRSGGLKASPTSDASRRGLWQKSFYDHVLRREEDAAAIARYILENPVRAGLADSTDEYPFAWSAYGSA